MCHINIPLPSPIIFFFLPNRPTPRSTLYPYTTLFRSKPDAAAEWIRDAAREAARTGWADRDIETPTDHIVRDRKSTRLNSSHTVISYAVFCLKKKTQRGLNIKRDVLIYARIVNAAGCR